MPGISESRRRYAGIMTGAASGFLARGLAVATALAAVSLTLPYLGKERFGAWATITALQVWLQLGDLGLAAALNNPLADMLSKSDAIAARRLLTTALASAVAACALLMGVTLLLVFGTDVLGLVPFESASSRAEFSLALVAGVGFSLLGIPNAIVSKVMALQHKAYVANLWMAGGQCLAMAGLLVCSRLEIGLLGLTAWTTGTVAACHLASLAWFYRSNPALRPARGDASLQALRSLAPVSLSYTALQSAGMLLSNSATFIVSAALSPVATAVFAATSRLTNLCSLVAQLASPYFWASYADAVVRGERSWMRQAFRRHLLASVGSTLAFALPLALFGDSIVRWWTKGMVSVEGPLTYWLLAWQLIVATMNPIGSLLNAHELYRLQTSTSLLAGIAGATAGYLLAPRLGVHAVPAAITCAYLVLVVIPTSLQARRILAAP